MTIAEATPAAEWSLPPAEKAQFKTNFIRQAVCELRFPTLFELVENGKKPPPSFSKALRKEYPNYAMGTHLDGTTDVPTNTHTFKSKGAHWTVSLRASAVVLETNKYTSFDEFQDRLARVILAAREVIDSDFYTRIGLRYINALPYSPESIQEWINPALSGPFLGGLGRLEENYGRIRGATPVGGFLLQHGIGPTMGISSSLIDKTLYSLDFDLFSEDVSADEALSVVGKLHELEYSLFAWALGPAARDQLGPSTLKAKNV